MELFTQHAATLLAFTLELLLKSTALLTLAFAITGLARKSSAAAKHMLWTAIMAILLALPLIIALAPQWQILPRWQSENPIPQSKATTIIHAITTPLLAISEPQRPTSHPTTSTPTLTPSPTPAIAQSQKLPWQTWAIALYLLGTLLTLSPMLIALAWFHRLRRTARPLPTWNPLLADARRLLNTHRPITLLESPHIRMPMTLGALHPHILLPPQSAAWPTEKRRLVLLHETAHILRLDVLTHTLANLVRALYWPHPLIWLAHRQMTLEAERAADDRVLLATHQSAAYARTLLEIAAALTDKHPLIGGIAMARKSTLESRIRGVMQEARNRRGVSTIGAAAVSLLALAVALPLGMMRTLRADTPPAAPQHPRENQEPVDQKTLPGGVVVHLVGITRNNGERGPWWLADGSPMFPPMRIGDSWSKGNGYLLNIQGSDVGGFGPLTDAPGMSEPREMEPKGGSGAANNYFFMNQDELLPTLRVGVGVGAWKIEIETVWGGSGKSDGGQIAVGQPEIQTEGPQESSRNHVVVGVAYTFDPRKVDWRLVAVDKDGKEHVSILTSRGGTLPPLRQSTVQFYGTSIESIKSLRFETRPMEWVEFKGFVTDPGATAVSHDVLVQRTMAAREALHEVELKEEAELAQQRTAFLAYAKAQKETADPAKPDPTPAQPGNYYIMGGARPGVYQLGPQKLTLLQAVVASGITQTNVADVHIQVVRPHGDKTSVTLATLLRGDDAGYIQPGDVVWIKDFTDLRARKEQLQAAVEQLSDAVQQAEKNPSLTTSALEDVRNQLARTQKELKALTDKENE